MAPDEKAKDLVLKFKQLPQEGTLAWYLSFELSKQCALIAIDEILKKPTPKQKIFWTQVKQEIEKL